MAAAPERRMGFTLIESLAALGMTALIVFCATSLLRDGAFFFDRGTRAADQTEQFALATDRLARDFGAARYVLQNIQGKSQIAFAASPEGVVRLISDGGTGGARRDEVIEFSIESEGDSRRLVRRSAAWIGPRARFDEVALSRPVVLLSGPFDMSFKFAGITAEGDFDWREGWSGAGGLPRRVKLTLIDVTTGVDLLPGDGFPIFADAPMSCATGKDECLALSKTGAGPGASTNLSASSQRPGQDTP
jgi:type II secretory pathway pseudopilin PulG